MPMMSLRRRATRGWFLAGALAAAAASLVIAAAPGQAATVCDARSDAIAPGTWISEGGARGDVILTCREPRVIRHTGPSAAASYRVVGIRWSSWGGARAVGVGYAVGCQMGDCFRTRATMTALNRRQMSAAGCGPGRYSYLTLRLRTRFGTLTHATSYPQCHFTD